MRPSQHQQLWCRQRTCGPLYVMALWQGQRGRLVLQYPALLAQVAALEKTRWHCLARLGHGDKK